ncbi:MAG: septal ring lytic transglycosylase RlpA family protein, partial [Candidatus Acidiferrales bacterium]
MKVRMFVVLQTVFLGVGLLVLTPAANPTVAGNPGNPPPADAAALQTTSKTNHTAASKGQPKPLAIWECTTSWYGEDFDGQPTANGETYDMYADTAAHPTLPLGSIVRVV